MHIRNIFKQPDQKLITLESVRLVTNSLIKYAKEKPINVDDFTPCDDVLKGLGQFLKKSELSVIANSFCCLLELTENPFLSKNKQQLVNVAELRSFYNYFKKKIDDHV